MRTLAMRLFGVACTALGLALLTLLTAAPEAVAQEVRYLLPAPASLPAFGPWMVAQQRGYFRAEGLAVTFETAPGGLAVAERLAAGAAIVGGAIGDTPILVRPNGVKVRAVAILGGGSLMQLVINRAKGIDTVAGLKGRTVAVLSGQDSMAWALRGMLMAQGLGAGDVTLRQAGPDELVRLFLSGQVEAMAAVPEWTAQAVDAGMRLAIVSPDPHFPSTAQAILASDDGIAQNPEQIRKLVRGTLRGLQAIIENPAAAADDYAKAVPAFQRRETTVARVFRLYAEQVYRGQKVPGEIDEARLQALQEVYLRDGIIAARTPVGELYTNAFVK